MRTKFMVSSLAAVAIAAAACSSNSKDPLSPSPGAKGTVTLAAPTAAFPSPDEQVGWLEQPFTLRVTNAALTGSSATPVTYEFDLANDAAFTDILFHAQDVAQGTDTTSVELPQIPTPRFLFWRARASNGTVTSGYSPAVKFELEAQGCHVSPEEYKDPQGDPLSEEYAEAIIYGCEDEFPHTVAVFGSTNDAEVAAEELLLRIIWHLKQAGFDAAQQRNPSGAVSRDKLNIYIRQSWRTYDIFSLGQAGIPTSVSGLAQVTPENPIPTDGIPD
jgi:hypothetical protein